MLWTGEFKRPASLASRAASQATASLLHTCRYTCRYTCQHERFASCSCTTVQLKLHNREASFASKRNVWVQEQEHSGEQSRMRQLPAAELLVQMPFLQKLLQRLLDCKPTGAASHDTVVQVNTRGKRGMGLPGGRGRGKNTP